MPPTIRELAQHLNLSIAAVSRALDGYPDISEATRQRVFQAAEEMGYVPNRAARQLRRKKAEAIGYILPAETPRFSDPFFSEFVAGLGDETATHPFDLLISLAPPGEAAEQRIYQNWVQSRKVDGFILNRMHCQDWRVDYLARQEMPFATLEPTQDNVDYPYVKVDNQRGMLALVQHLAERGFRRLAYLGGPETLVIQAERLAGFQAGLQAQGLPLRAEFLVNGELTSAGGYQATQSLCSLPEPPDALVCIDDVVAIGALRAAHELGLRVGQEVGISGFDGVQASRYSEPPLTTLDIPVYEIATTLVKMLAARMSGQPYDNVLIQPRLLIRESTLGISPSAK